MSLDLFFSGEILLSTIRCIDVCKKEVRFHQEIQDIRYISDNIRIGYKIHRTICGTCVTGHGSSFFQ